MTDTFRRSPVEQPETPVFAGESGDGGNRTHESVRPSLSGRPELMFTVLGRPQPAGSKRAFVNPKTGKVIVTEDAKRSKPWQQQVGDTALAHRNGSELLTGPLELDVTFVLARPKGHYGSGRNADQIRAGAPTRPVVKPDTTKLLRAVEDALTGVVYMDDAQIVDQSARKVYGSPERVEITLREAA